MCLWYAELASGAFGQAIRSLSSSKSIIHALFDNDVMILIAPAAIALLWLVLQHMRDASQLSMAALLCIITSPVALATAWPEVAKLLGHEARSAGLLRIVSIIYSITALFGVLSGGTIGLFALTLMVQLLTRIHGPDVWSLLIP